MIRKSMLALAAIATVGAAALAPTSASAWGYKGWGLGFGPHLGWGHSYYGYAYAPRVVHYGHDCWLQKRINRRGHVYFVRVCS
jgi:hypothetical protein